MKNFKNYFYFLCCFRRQQWTVLCTLYLLTVMLMSVNSNSSSVNNTYTCAYDLPEKNACEVTITNEVYTFTSEPIYFKSQLDTVHTLKCIACNISHLSGFRSASKALHHFDFSNCQVNQMEMNAIEDFNGTRIQTISLAKNNIKQLNSRLFAATPHLTTLNLSHNSIFEIHPETFYGNTNLQTLLLHNNRIVYLDVDTFAYLGKLHILKLHNNYIKTISIEHFIYNVQLLKITLNNNTIESISKNALLACPNLEYFDLSQNPITTKELTVNSKITILQRSNLIDLNVTETVTLVNASENNLSIINLSAAHSLHTIDLSANNLSEINFKNNSKLKVINLSNNQFSTIDFSGTNMMELYLSGNELSLIELNSNELVILHASDNIISGLKLSSFTDNLKYVNLSNNELVEFEFERFQPKLHRLDLSFNSISKINVKNCPNLRELFLGSNSLDSISELEILSSLIHLDVSFNNLDVIDVETFVNMTELKFLNLRNNELRMLSFMTQLHLERLDVSNNRLDMIDVNSFLHLRDMHELYIAGNHLKEIQSIDELQQMPKLRYIDLRNNLWKCSEYFAISKYFLSHRQIQVDLETKEKYYCSNENIQNEKLNILHNFTAIFDAFIKFKLEDIDANKNKSILKLIKKNSKLSAYISDLYLEDKNNGSMDVKKDCFNFKSNSIVVEYCTEMYLIMFTLIYYQNFL